MGLELYLDLLSQVCRAVYVFTKRNSAPWSCSKAGLRVARGQHHSDAFAQVNPMGKVLALKDRDFTLAESVAILLYLSRKYETPDHLYPQDIQTCIHVDEYLAWQHMALRSSCTCTLWQKVVFPVFLGEPVPPETLAAKLAKLDRCLQLLEDKFLQNKAFLAGPHISPVSAGCQIFEDRPILPARRQCVEAAVREDLFQAAHAVIMKAKDLPPVDPSMKKLRPLV
ncbi:glutathione S-transferase theta-1-like [Trichechus inunguis]